MTEKRSNLPRILILSALVVALGFEGWSWTMHERLLQWEHDEDCATRTLSTEEVISCMKGTIP